jgi:hypothetical protein
MGRGHGAAASGATGGGKRACEAQTKRAAPCAAFALPGRPWCISHDPERHADMRAARAKGGAAASKLRALQGRRAKLDTPQRLLTFTSNLIHDVVEVRIHPDTARVALYGCSIARQLIEASDLEARLAALESQLATGGRRGRWHG